VPGIHSSSASLAWPHGSEFADSYIQFRYFLTLALRLSHHDPYLVQLLEDAPPSSFHGLGGHDYHQSLIADIMASGLGLFSCADVLGLPGLRRVIDKASFRTINPEAFLRVCASIPPISSLLL
jgi:hypothetical protein